MSDTDLTDDSLYRTMKLRKTIRAAGKEYDELELRPPTIGERRTAEGRFRRGIDVETSTNYGIALISLVTKVNEAAISMMDTDQFEEAFAFLQGFTDRGRQTGGTSAST